MANQKVIFLKQIFKLGRETWGETNQPPGVLLVVSSRKLGGNDPILTSIFLKKWVMGDGVGKNHQLVLDVLQCLFDECSSWGGFEHIFWGLSKTMDESTCVCHVSGGA